MIVVVEPLCEGREHSPFNAGIIRAAARISGDGRVIFLAEAAHLSAVKECMDARCAASVQWREIRIPPRHTHSFRERFMIARRIFGAAWTAAAQGSAKAIIVTAITEAGLTALKLKFAQSRRPFPVGVIFHSGLGRFLGTRRGRMILSTGNYRQLRLLVLGKYIRQYTVERVSAARDYVDVLPHPLVEMFPARNLDTDCLRFGFLGLGNIAKGFVRFIELAREFQEEPGAAKALFEMVGRPAPECAQLFETERQKCSRLVTARLDDSQWPWELYRERADALSYAVLPFDEVTYAYTYSGSALDAVAAAKPMIVSDTPAFRELFSQMGDIGYICKDVREMRQVVQSIAANPPVEQYARQCENLVRGRQMFELDTVAMRLCTILGIPDCDACLEVPNSTMLSQ